MGSFSENIKIAFQSLFLNKLRSVLTMLGIIIGVGAVVAVMSIGSGAQDSVIASIQGIGSNLIIIIPGSSQEDMGALNQFSTANKESLKLEDVEAIKKYSRHVRGVIPVILSAAPVTYFNKGINASVYASSEDAEKVYNFEIERGKFFSKSDVANSANVACIGPTVSDKLFGDEDPLGKTMKVMGRNFKIIGTIKSKGTNMFGQDQDNAMAVPITTAMNKLYGQKYLSMIIADTETEKDIDIASEEIIRILRKQHGLKGSDKNDFSIQSQTEILEALSTVTNIFTITIGSIAAISLLVGGIGIMNIMLVSVTERTREIGIRKAIGAKNRDILIQFLTESVVLSMSGGIMGIIFAGIIALVLNRYSPIAATISPFSILLAVSFSTFVGLFFGIYPAMRAAGLNPIEALRFE
ncbi:MAG TPA: FtsX-like permease family protein [Actinobacteria bacterium]|nr:FtsX-like permease family protein [Actinomycetota bacterium]